MLRHVVGIVSGGASGLGAAAATHILRNGGKVLIGDLPHQYDTYLQLASNISADAAMSAINPDFNEKVIAWSEMDVTQPETIEAALDCCETTFGEPVNVVVCCAGTATAKRILKKKPEGARVHSSEDFIQSIMVNTVGTFNMCRLGARRIASREPNKHDSDGLRGCIVNTSSIAAFDGQIGQTAYAASKGAIVAMTLPMARDLAPYGIRVVTIAPGLFKTPLLAGLPDVVQTQLGQMAPCPNRLGDPAEFGMLVGSIITNPMLNGEVIRLDGALRMPP